MKTGEDRDELNNISVDNELLEDSDLTSEEKIDEVIDEVIDEDTEMYNFGWSRYSEITNGRFAMIGFVAIILIELFSQQSFLKWAGIL